MAFAKTLEVLSSRMVVSTTATQFGLLLMAAWVLSCFLLCIYRLYFHPLSQFPGDRLAAATGWVETYHDVFRGGQFIFKVEEWHAKYGPIVRISPWEVHIADPDFVDTLFSSNSQYEKKREWKYRFGIPHSTFDTIEHHHHRLRRSAIAPFFAKQKIAGITDYISSKAQRLCDRLEAEYKTAGRPANLSEGLTALTFDIITYYIFARSFEYIERPNFEAPFTNAAKKLATTLHTMGHFPWLLTILQSLPNSVALAMNPTVGAVVEFHGAIENQIRDIKSGANDAHYNVAHKTVFNELLNSDLPPEEKSAERLKHEAASLVGGGVETTAATLAKASFFILDNPRIKAKLLAELATVFPDPHSTPALPTLEALPYLRSVVDEILRMTIGISARTIRKSPAAPVRYGHRVIPPGAYFSMTTYYTHKDAAIWEAPDEFRPERWLARNGAPVALNGQPLAKYLVAFARGPRMCVGMNLARAELFIVLAVLFRRCDMALFETTRAAVDMKADHVIPFPDPTTEGVRVLVN
ncbi:cytochrome P450 [Xylaria arbuscula]|nr:cytochrome P450 [Xylaria arbuscula]